MATGKIAMEGSSKTSPIIKLTASTLLTTFYGLKTKAHKEREDSYLELAKGFPQAGDCNPYTNATCFCYEETSRAADPVNYQKFCAVKGLHSNKSNAVSCVTQDFKPDPACSCKAKGTCIQARIASVGQTIGLGATTVNSQFQPLKSFSTGFDNGNLVSGTGKRLAFAKKYLNKIKPNKVSFKNNNQKSLAKEIMKYGIPKFPASKLATSQANNSAPATKYSALIGSGLSPNLKKAISSSKEQTSFRSGRSARKEVTAQRSRSRRRSKNKGAKAIEIQDFAQKAQKEALKSMISKDKSRPIFDIITYRYKTSAWKQFKDHINKEVEEAKE